MSSWSKHHLRWCNWPLLGEVWEVRLFFWSCDQLNRSKRMSAYQPPYSPFTWLPYSFINLLLLLIFYSTCTTSSRFTTAGFPVRTWLTGLFFSTHTHCYTIYSFLRLSFSQCHLFCTFDALIFPTFSTQKMILITKPGQGYCCCNSQINTSSCCSGLVERLVTSWKVHFFRVLH